ncbi:Uncharacterised protein [Vibrio cholerae]|nr:Uncharacterised protein [Vibrio cholerae]CSI83241.1 Uncharacterised protein [Vibrio cholerae]
MADRLSADRVGLTALHSLGLQDGQIRYCVNSCMLAQLSLTLTSPAPAHASLIGFVPRALYR